MSRVFTSARDSVLCELIATARKRLVIVAPALSKEVGDAFKARIEDDGGPIVIAVIVDIDPEVCRLGYGEIAAINPIRDALATRGIALQMQAGIRIGLVVADEEILVFSPTPKLVEAGSTEEGSPNAIRITPTAALDIANACGAGFDEIVPEFQEVGLDFVDERKLAATKANLEEVPPRSFDLARLERVFNYHLEYVEFSVEDFRLNTKSVPLPPELLGLAEQGLRERIRNSFRVFEAGVPFEFKIPDPVPPVDSNALLPPSPELTVSEKWLGKEAARIRDEYFIPLGSSAYGNLILKRRKKEFEADVARLRTLVETYAEKVKSSIASKVTETRDSLVAALFPRVKANPPESWLRRSFDGKLSEDTLRQRLEVEVDRAFEKVKQDFKPKVVCIFKGVNYETITADKHFRERIEAHFGKDEAAKLLSEHDASRAK